MKTSRYSVVALPGLAAVTVGLLAVGMLAAGTLTSGCKTFSVKTPSGYVKYKRTWRYYRGVSPDNAVIVVRSWKNKPKGSLKFWVEVVEREMKYGLGYKLVKKSDVEAGGHKGVQMHYNVASRGRLHTYILALFVTKKRIYAIEATTFHKYLKRHKPAFSAALSSLKFH